MRDIVCTFKRKVTKYKLLFILLNFILFYFLLLLLVFSIMFSKILKFNALYKMCAFLFVDCKSFNVLRIKFKIYIFIEYNFIYCFQKQVALKHIYASADNRSTQMNGFLSLNPMYLALSCLAVTTLGNLTSVTILWKPCHSNSHLNVF